MDNIVLKIFKRDGFKRGINKIIKAIKYEKNNPLKLPILKRIKCWNKGFKSSSYYIYDLKNAETKDYVSDVIVAQLSNVNDEEIKLFLNDKLKFESIASKYVNVPKNFFVIRNGIIQSIDEGSPYCIDTLIEYCTGIELVLKPIDGNRGKGVMFLLNKDNKLLLNNQIIDQNKLKTIIEKLDNYIILERIKQANYSEKIFSETSNTIRLLVMRNPYENNKPFIAAAVHRFGRKETIPVDNWSRGGLSANIDISDGKLGCGVMHPRHTNGELKFYKTHPDSGSQIEGVTIPYWEDIKDIAIDLTIRLNIRYVGWDILVTNNGFYFIEGNCNSDLDLIQVHNPLLKDERVVKFLKYSGNL